MSSSSKIKIAIVDDHELFRTGLLTHLSIYDDLDIVINVEKGNELLKILENQSIDLILMDISLPDINGINITKILKRGIIILKLLC